MATTRGQRIGIWLIAAIMMIGTVGGFIAMMVQPGNEARDKAEMEKLTKEYGEIQAEHKKKVDAQAASLSEKYYGKFSPYASRVAAFDGDAVKELSQEDLALGEGDEINNETKFSAYYIGWNAKGEIFDQSIESSALKSPFAIDGLANASVIEGWKKGLVGMKIGGVRELTIPSAQAYGEQGAGEKIPANAPLKFIVMVVAQPETISQPEMPQKLKEFYKRKYGIDF